MTKILCFSDEVETAKMLAAVARELGEPYLLLIGGRGEAENICRYGLKKVYYSDLKPYTPEGYLKVLSRVADAVRPEIIMLPSTIKGRTVAGMYSGLKGWPCITDVIAVRTVDGSVEVSRLAFGGMASVRVRTKTPVLICISPGVSAEVREVGEAPIEEVKPEVSERVRVDYKPREPGEVEPDKADVVIVAGKGFKKREDLEMAKELARILGGAWGVTRPLAADYGWASTWIGMTGLTIKPKLYIGIGVSGSPYHMVGVRASKVILSINIDPDAPIFEESDYGIVGDLYQVLPRLINRLKEVRG